MSTDELLRQNELADALLAKLKSVEAVLHRVEGLVIASAVDLAGALGMSDRAARRVLKNLECIDAIRVVERNVSGAGKFRGQLKIFVRRPKSVAHLAPTRNAR